MLLDTDERQQFNVFHHFHLRWMKRFPADIEKKLRINKCTYYFCVKGCD